MKKIYFIIACFFVVTNLLAAPLQGIQRQHFSKIGGFSLGDSCDDLIDTLGDPTEEGSVELLYVINKGNKSAKIKFFCDVMTWEVYEILVLEADPAALRSKKIRIPGWELSAGIIRPHHIIKAFGKPDFISDETYSIYYKLPRNIWLNIGLSETNSKAEYFAVLKDPAFLQNGERSLSDIKELVTRVKTENAPIVDVVPRNMERNTTRNNRGRTNQPQRRPSQPQQPQQPQFVPVAPAVQLPAKPQYLDNALDASFDPDAPILWKEKKRRGLDFEPAINQEFYKFSNYVRKNVRFDPYSGILSFNSNAVEDKARAFFNNSKRTYNGGGIFGGSIKNYVHDGDRSNIWYNINQYAPSESEAAKRVIYQKFITNTDSYLNNYQRNKWAILRNGPAKASSKYFGSYEVSVILMSWIICDGFASNDVKILVDRWNIIQKKM